MFYLFFWFFIFYIFCTSISSLSVELRSLNCGSGGNLSLHEVVLHETLEVEISELIGRLDLEKSGELGIRDDLSAIILILEVVGANISIDLLAHGSARKLGAGRLSEEGSKLVTDARGLDKSRRGTVSRPLLLGGLLSGLDLAGDRLLEGLVIGLKGGKNAKHLLELGAELVHLGDNRKLDGLDGASRGNNLIRKRSRVDSGNCLLNHGGLGSLLRSTLLRSSLLDGGGNGDRGGSSNNSLRRTNHF